jgi:hypothetical protein
MFGLLLSFPIHTLTPDAIAATSFDRVFGNATLAGIDADKRTINLLMFNIFALPLCFMVSFVALRFIANIKKYASNNELVEWVDSASICGTVTCAIMIIARYSYQEIGSLLYAPSIIGFFVIAGLIYSRKAIDRLPVEDFKFAVYLSFALALLLNFLTQSSSAQSVVFNYRIIGIFAIVGLVLLTVFSLGKYFIDRVRTASIPLFFGMFAVGCFLELTNILNQHNIFIVNRIGGAKLIALAIIALSVIRCFVKSKLLKSWESVACIGIILGLTYFTAVPPLIIDATSELFERANAGMLVYDVIHFGKIPLLESFDGHMLSGSLNGVIFSLLNGTSSIDGSYFMNYNFWGILINIGMFLLLRQVFGNAFAFFAVICVPVPYIRFFVIPAAAFLHAMKRQSFGSWLWYFMTIFFAACYEFPTAFAIGGGTFVMAVIVLAIQSMQERKLVKELQTFIKAGGVFVAGFGVLYIVICLIKGLNPISRARYFLGLVASNRNWAYSTIGDTKSYLFALIYAFVPAIAVVITIFVLYKCLSVKMRQSNSGMYGLGALILAYFFNYQRMLGRHALAEQGNGIRFGLEFFFIALLFIGSVFVPQFKRQLFVVVSIVFPLLFTDTFAQTSVIQNSLAAFNNSGIYYDATEEKVQRVTYDNVRAAHASVINMINTVMATDETYMDLSSETMLYALTGKEKPTYINQSILHLSGEYTQEAFIAEIENYGEKCAYALWGGWNGLDGIESAVKYYEVWEYLNENFLPLCKESVESYSLWVRKEKYADASAKLLATARTDEISIAPTHLTDNNWENGILKSDNSTVLLQNAPDSFGRATSLIVDGVSIPILSTEMKDEYQWVHCTDTESAEIIANAESVSFIGEIMDFPLIDYSAYNHYYNAGYIPYLWGEFDSRKAYQNPVVQDLQAIPEVIPVDKQSHENYILLNISAEQNDTGYLDLTDEANSYGFGYVFNIKQGEHRYLFRVSADNYWTLGNFTLSYSANAGAQPIAAALLEGD